MTPLLLHALYCGAVLSLLLGVLFAVVAMINPEIWVPDYPPDIRERFGPISARARTQRQWAALPFVAIVAGVLTWGIHTWTAKVGSVAFVDAAAITFIAFNTFNLFDLVLDWLVFIVIRPRRIVLPGTAGASGYDDLGFHVRASGKGLLGSIVLALTAGGIAVAIGE
jgi:hypothetical protein